MSKGWDGPYYACAIETCSDEVVREAGEMYWWPGDETHAAGWYCDDCVRTVLMDEMFAALVRLAPRPLSTAKPWPADVKIVPAPNTPPEPRFICNSCDRSFAHERLVEHEPDGSVRCESCHVDFTEWLAEAAG